MMFFITMQIPSWFFGAMLPDPTERERERERGSNDYHGACSNPAVDPWYCRCHYRRPRALPLRVRRREPVYAGPQPPQDPDLGLGPRYRLGPVPPARQRG